MPEPLIIVQDVAKRFRRGAAFDSLRDLIADKFSPSRRLARLADSEFWALGNVSFEVAPGEAFGIIGPNGAGKSTMLKLMAGILRPDAGRIQTVGRLSALIELGAGFHGDLSGRENIYLNASILGMSRREVRARFDEIVEFAGIGDFLDTPVKRFSSGMHARLGFAVAAHAKPQILLVDEVLSVGDRAFRAKCIDKMRGFLHQGVAVVFVSHDLGAVGRFCRRAMVLDHGRPICCTTAGAAIARYYEASDALSAAHSGEPCQVEIENVLLRNLDGPSDAAWHPGDRLVFKFDVLFHCHLEDPSFGMSLLRTEDQCLVFETSSTRLDVSAPPARPGDRLHVEYHVTLNTLPGEYSVGLHVRDRNAATYCLEHVSLTRLFVHGSPNCGGLAYLDPTVRITKPPAPPREATNPRRAAEQIVR